MLTNNDLVCYNEKNAMHINDFQQSTLTSRFLIQSKQIDESSNVNDDIVSELKNIFSIQSCSAQKKNHTRIHPRHGGTKKNQYK
jgi:hypothetical protein